MIARAALVANAATIDASHLLFDTPHGEHADRYRDPRPATHIEKADFVAIAREQRGNASAIARILSTSRTHVRRLASRFGVELEDLRR